MMKKLFLINLLLSVQLSAINITVKIFQSSDIEQFEFLIMQQRQQEFSKFPYLMNQGDEFEIFYANSYTNASSGALAVAYNEDNDIVGFLTGMELAEFDGIWDEFGCELISDKLKEKIDPIKNYYLGDVIVLEKYRNQRIADRLFEALEKHAKDIGYTSTSFITVIRNDNHPQRPTDYKSPTNVWRRLGYTKSECIVTYSWPTRQTDDQQIFKPEDNRCDIWIKNI